jgi:hypothetical protein
MRPPTSGPTTMPGSPSCWGRYGAGWGGGGRMVGKPQAHVSQIPQAAGAIFYPAEKLQEGLSSMCLLDLHVARIKI